MNITILLEMWQSTIMITGDYRAAIPTWLQYEYVMLGPYLTKSVEGDGSDASFITVLLR
jgi:hypothetical protein